MQSSSGTSEPRKRRRTAKSCEQCRHRKVGCDQAHPCGPCRRSRDHLTCTYRDSAITAPPYVQPGSHSPVNGRQSAPGAGTGQSYPHQTSRFEVLDTGLVPAANTGAIQRENTLSSSNGHRETNLSDLQPQTFANFRREADETARRLEERIQRLETEARSTHRESRGEAPSSTLSVSAVTTPRLRFTKAKVKFFAQSHWVHTAEKAFDLGSFDSEIEPTLGLDKEEWRKAYNGLRTLRQSVKVSQRPDVGMTPEATDIHEIIPSRDVCETLVANYMRTFGRIYRIVNMPELRGQLDQFWSDAKSLPQTFIVKLSLILAIAVPFTYDHQRDVDSDALRRSAQRWIYAAQSWLSGPAEKSTQNLLGLQMFCLLAIARHVNGLGISSPFFSTASLVSMARQMGLDRDTKEFSTLSLSHAELINRLWSTIVELSLVSYLESGTPLVGLDEFGAKQPSNINDSELKDSSLLDEPLATDDSITDMSTHLVLLKSRSLRVRALGIINNGIGPQTSYEVVVELADQLRKACAEASTFFSAHSSELGPESLYHKMYVDMYLRKHILLLHRPFMLAAREDPRFHLSRKICVESCMIIASYINEESTSGGVIDVSKMMIHGSGFLRGALSLDIIVTLAYELNIQLQEEGPSQALGAYDPARELSRAGREPIVRRLEHIKEQLGKSIAQGNPSLKRFIMVSALLAQIETLESGGNVKAAIYDAVKDGIQICTKSLEAYLAQHTPQPVDVDGAATPWADEADMDLGTMDFETLMNPLLLFSCSEF